MSITEWLVFIVIRIWI